MKNIKRRAVPEKDRDEGSRRWQWRTSLPFLERSHDVSFETYRAAWGQLEAKRRAMVALEDTRERHVAELEQQRVHRVARAAPKAKADVAASVGRRVDDSLVDSRELLEQQCGRAARRGLLRRGREIGHVAETRVQKLVLRVLRAQPTTLSALRQRRDGVPLPRDRVQAYPGTDGERTGRRKKKEKGCVRDVKPS